MGESTLPQMAMALEVDMGKREASIDMLGFFPIYIKAMDAMVRFYCSRGVGVGLFVPNLEGSVCQDTAHRVY